MRVQVRLLAVAAIFVLAVTVSRATVGTMQTYIVLYQDSTPLADAAGVIARAGGTLVYSYPQISVVIARSDDSSFQSNLLAASPGILGAAATDRFGVQLIDRTATGDSEAATATGTPAPGTDNLSGLQWDMNRIHSPEARAITGGSPSVVVGDIDTGLDYTHPDLAPNVDFTNSVSCVGGIPISNPAAWIDDNGHGTHTAGTIAAARNTIGIVGVAPNVKIAGIKAATANGFFFPEAVVCAFMWAGTHHIQVTNNSYFADPWLFNCRNDSEQRAIWEAERRAIRFAMQNGTVVVSSLGNSSDDLAHPTQDVTSPDDSVPLTRAIHNDCAVVPVEVSGVIGVAANGDLGLKSFYSNYGMGVTQVIAPGGDSILQRTAAAPNGRVLSTWPAYLAALCTRRVFDGVATYCYLQGTSMASPHVAGVAALIASAGAPRPGAIAARILNTSDRVACPPDLSIYAPFPSVSNETPQVCQGGAGYNSFNGRGQVNAYRAVTD